MCVSVNKLKPQELFDKQQAPVLQKVDMVFHLIMQLASLTLIHWTLIYLACENIRFSSLFAAGDFSRNVPSGEERGETDVFAGYDLYCG